MNRCCCPREKVAPMGASYIYLRRAAPMRAPAASAPLSEMTSLALKCHRVWEQVEQAANLCAYLLRRKQSKQNVSPPQPNCVGARGVRLLLRPRQTAFYKTSRNEQQIASGSFMIVVPVKIGRCEGRTILNDTSHVSNVPRPASSSGFE